MRKQAEKVTRFNQRPDQKMTEGSQSMSTWVFFLKNYRPQTEPDSIAFFCSQFMIAFLSAFELKPKKKGDKTPLQLPAVGVYP